MFKKFKEKLKAFVKKASVKIEEKKESEVEEKENESLKKIPEKKVKQIVSEKEFSKAIEELEFILLENNVALEVTELIMKELKQKILEKNPSKKEFGKVLKLLLKEIIGDVLLEPPDLIKKIKREKEPYVILFCGINGSGKTTTIAKLGSLFKSKGLSVVFAAADTFRAAAREQLEEHGKRLGIKVIGHEYGSDPASVGFDAIKFAKKNKIDCVLIDTAGRMYTEKNLLREIEKIVKVSRANLKIFVGESIAGNDAIAQIKAFDSAIGIDCLILSKADIDERGGTILSLGFTTKKPIIYLGNGQDYKDLKKFDKKDFVESLGL